MKPLLIDTEQEAMLRQLITGVSAFLLARSHRRDPAGIISKAYRLQERKAANLAFQLDQDPIAKWPDLAENEQMVFIQLIKEFIDRPEGPIREVLYVQIHAFIQSHRSEKQDKGLLHQALAKGKPK